MKDFKKYKRKQIAELRPVNQTDIKQFVSHGNIIINHSKDNPLTISVSDSDTLNGSPKLGDMIARNPKNHLDQWLIAEKYFNDNFEEL